MLAAPAAHLTMKAFLCVLCGEMLWFSTIKMICTKEHYEAYMRLWIYA